MVEGLVIKGGPQVEVLNGISLHGGLAASWPVEASVTAKVVVESLIEHWRAFGLPGYAQFDNDTIFQGPHAHPDVIGRVSRLCLSLGVVPVFVVPHEFGFQSMIENYNGTWQAKVWARFQHGSLPGLAGALAAVRDRPASPPGRSHRVGPPAACLPETLALEPPVSTPGPDHLLEADQCGGDGGGVGPELRGGPALAESVGASGGGPGRGQDPHLPASPEGAEGPAALEGVAPSYQEEKVLGVTGRTCSIEHEMQIEHAHLDD